MSCAASLDIVFQRIWATTWQPPVVRKTSWSLFWAAPKSFPHETSGNNCKAYSHLMSVKKTMFFLVLVWGRAVEPNFESGRLIRRWLAGHWIAARFPSCEIQTTRPILPHCGHFLWSPMLTISCRLPLFVVYVGFSSFFLSQRAMNSHGWFAFSTILHYICFQNAQHWSPFVNVIWKDSIIQ